MTGNTKITPIYETESLMDLLRAKKILRKHNIGYRQQSQRDKTVLSVQMRYAGQAIELINKDYGNLWFAPFDLITALRLGL